jgi:hypothetical protein
VFAYRFDFNPHRDLKCSATRIRNRVDYPFSFEFLTMSGLITKSARFSGQVSDLIQSEHCQNKTFRLSTTVRGR